MTLSTKPGTDDAPAENGLAPRPEPEQGPDKWLGHMKVIFEHRTNPQSSQPGGPYSATLPGVRNCTGDSFEAALADLEAATGLTASDSAPAAEATKPAPPAKPPAATESTTTTTTTTAAESGSAE